MFGPPGRYLGDGLADGQYAFPDAISLAPSARSAMLLSPSRQVPTQAASGKLAAGGCSTISDWST
jgi:hypothetical protein